MKLLITGVAGFIGAKIADASLLANYKVIGIDNLSQGNLANIPAGVEFINLDLSDYKSYKSIPKDIDIILHLAGQSSGEISFDDPLLDLSKNTQTTLNLIQFGIANKIKKIIYASSMAVYGNVADKTISEHQRCQPLSCYGISKLTSEYYLQVYKKKLPFVIFRMFNVYGPGQDLLNLRQGMVSIYLSHAIKNNHIPVKGNINRFRDFIYIDDVVKIWMQAIANTKINNYILNLGTGKKTTIKDLLFSIKEILPNISWSEEKNTPGDQFGIYADISLLQRLMAISNMTSLSNGLKIFSKWAIENT